MTTEARNLSAQDLISLEDQYGAHNYHPLPVVLARGEGPYVWDVNGKRYIDCLSAYSAVNQGHCHPRIVEAMVKQAGTLTLTSRAFYNDQLGLFEKQVHDLFGYDKSLLMNSGAEAVETALKLARRWGYARKNIAEDRAKILVFDGNFHGRTISIISFSGDPASHDWFGPYTPGFVRVPYGDIDAMQRAMKDHNICALLVEPIQGEAGVVVPPDGFLRACYNACQANEALFIADEIQTGLGRTGKMLCVEHEGVRPDVVILGKALSGGLYPVSAVLANDDVMLCIKPGQHGSTYGGNPLACAVAGAALQVLVDDKLCERAQALGERFRSNLASIESPQISSIRGKGLLNAVVISPFVLAEQRHTAWDVCLALAERGVLAKPTHEHTIRLAPPLVVSEADVDACTSALADVLHAFVEAGAVPEMAEQESVQQR